MLYCKTWYQLEYRYQLEYHIATLGTYLVSLVAILKDLTPFPNSRKITAVKCCIARPGTNAVPLFTTSSAAL